MNQPASRRRQLLSELETMADANDRRATDVCFRILYGLPSPTQTAVAIFTLQRFLPIFERRRPGIGEPGELLSNPQAWVGLHGRMFPVEPGGQAESAFTFAIDALLLALAYPEDAFTLTSSSTCAVEHAISARASYVWAADDPEAAELLELGAEKARVLPKERSLLENPAARAVTRREWMEVARWLRRPEVLDAPDVADPADVEAALRRWDEIEHLILVPNKPWRESLRADVERLRKLRDGDEET
jgi:hypothetical protein